MDRQERGEMYRQIEEKMNRKQKEKDDLQIPIHPVE